MHRVIPTEKQSNRILVSRPDRVPIGPPITISKAKVSRVVLAALSLLALLLCKNAAVDLHLLPPAGENLWLRILNYKAVSNDGIAAIAAATVGAQLLLRQTSFQIQPHLMFYSRFDPERGKAILNTERAWCVDVLNSGNGPAVIENAFYILGLNGFSNVTGPLPYASVRKLIIDNGITETQDFVLQRLSPGAVVGASTPMMLLVIKNEVAWSQVNTLDVVIYYRSFAGGLSVKRISCIPEYWNE